MSWGLKAAVARLLPQNAGYEDKIYQKLVTQLPEYIEKVKRKAKALIKEQPELENREQVAIEHVAKQNKSKLGAFLIAADGATLREYNVLDAELTLQLYEEYCKGFTLQNFDWKHDHTLYMNSGIHIARSIGQGIFIDVPRLKAHIAQREALVAECIQKFETTYATELAAWKQLHNTSEFNIHSGKQLQSFVCDFMQVPPKFFTEKGSPSFKDEHLPTYGVIGELIRGSIEIKTETGTKTVPRATVELSLKQAKSLLELSERDSHWHFSMRLTGTVSGRYTTGGEI
jgi:DNA polymerase I-like protein with 3'-5' exonuclease and polymerase domains